MNVNKLKLIELITKKVKFDIGDTVIFRDGSKEMHVGFILRFKYVKYSFANDRVEIEYEIRCLLENYNVADYNIFKFNKKDADLIKEYKNRWMGK